MASLGDQTTPSIRRPRRPRTRTLLGCLTCRLRHVKCSLERPSCRNCERLAIECAGYGGKLKWLNYEGRDGKRVVLANGKEGDGERGAGRREMFSLTERKRMSQTMMACLGKSAQGNTNQRLSRALENLDSETMTIDTPEDPGGRDGVETTLVGPFGVFRTRLAALRYSEPLRSPSPISRSTTIGSDDGQYEQEASMFAAPGTSSTLGDDPVLFQPAISPLAPPRVGASQARSELRADISASPYSGGPIGSVAGTQVSWEPDDLVSASQLVALQGQSGSLPPSFNSPGGATDGEVEDISDTIDRLGSTSLQPTVPSHELSRRSYAPYLTRPKDLTGKGGLISLDQNTLFEIYQLLPHFSHHLSCLLSPLALPGPNIRAKGCLDRALLCFSKINIFGYADADALAVMYSLLGVSAAHLDAIYRPVYFNLEPTKPVQSRWREPASRYTKLSIECLDQICQQESLVKGEYKNALNTLLNLNLAAAMTNFSPPHSNLLRHTIHFIARKPPRIAATTQKSTAVLCLEYLLLQDCVLNSALLALKSQSPPSSSLLSVDDIRLLCSPDIWASFLIVSENSYKEHSSSPGHTREQGNWISARDLRLQVGSPVPPSLLRLILEHALLLQKTGAGMEPQPGEVSSLEKRISEWMAEAGDDLDDISQGSDLEDVDSDKSESDDESSDDDVEDKEDTIGRKPAPSSQKVAALLTRAYYTTLLLDFFSCTKPTNELLLRPLRRKLLTRLQAYVRAVDEANLDVGIGTGLIWPMKVLERVGPEKRDRKEADRLWGYVTGAGFRASATKDAN